MRLIQSALRLEPGEQRKVLLMLLYSILSIAAPVVVGRTAAATLFLGRLDPKWLPWTYVASAVAVSLFAAAYTRLGQRARQDRVMATSALTAAVVTILLRLGLSVLGDSFAFLTTLFVLMDVMGDILVLQFWVFARVRRRPARGLGARAGRASGAAQGVTRGGAFSARVARYPAARGKPGRRLTCFSRVRSAFCF